MLPWTDTTTLDQRRAFIAAWAAGHDSVAELARRFRISRKTAYKFIDRFKLLGDAGLHDLPRAPRNPRATDPQIATTSSGTARCWSAAWTWSVRAGTGRFSAAWATCSKSCAPS